jgi:peroxiredoxin
MRWLLILLALTPVLSAAADAPLPGRPAPDFVLPAAVGANERLSEHRGEVVVLSFWSTRCSLCTPQLAALDELYARYRSAGLVALAVSVDDDPQRARDYARAHQLRYPLLIDATKAVGRAYAVELLPTLVLIDRAGAVRYVQSDYHPNDTAYVAEVRRLLDDAVPADSNPSVR